MFEEDHPQSPDAPATPGKKRVGSAVVLAAGGVVVATLFATVAAMLAASGQEAAPERASADVVQTITSVAPDGSTSTVVVTVPAAAKASGKAGSDRKQAARPGEQPPSHDPAVPPQVTTNPDAPGETHSNPPTSWTEPATSTSSAGSSTATTPPVPPSSGTSSSPVPPKP
ncbi:hypothetical protein [Nocardia sp. NRRL S-836]|uniref:hypothetical protein n=1 Tax=Nocardia sp. NRRL S-836 TaxID=1519492 RepID=UPI000ABBF3E0|nr:hypothetical protein [Nocardia sp. NRRL S-836]